VKNCERHGQDELIRGSEEVELWSAPFYSSHKQAFEESVEKVSRFKVVLLTF